LEETLQELRTGGLILAGFIGLEDANLKAESSLFLLSEACRKL
jgi:hypothetical protein